MSRRTKEFQHVLDRHGLWEQARCTPPLNDFGPRVNLGLILLAAWAGDEYRDFVRSASRSELALFISLCAALSDDVMEAYAITNAIHALGSRPSERSEKR